MTRGRSKHELALPRSRERQGSRRVGNYIICRTAAGKGTRVHRDSGRIISKDRTDPPAPLTSTPSVRDLGNWELVKLESDAPTGRSAWQWRAVQRHRAARVVADCALDCPPGEQVDRRPEPRLCFVPDDRTARREGPPALKRA